MILQDILETLQDGEHVKITELFTDGDYLDTEFRYHCDGDREYWWCENAQGATNDRLSERVQKLSKFSISEIHVRNNTLYLEINRRK